MSGSLENLVMGGGVALAVFLIIYGFWIAFRVPLMENYARFSDLYRRTYVLELQFPDNVTLVLGAYIVAVLLVVGFFVIVKPFLAPILLVVGYFAPKFYFEYQKSVRRERVDNVLPNVLQQLSANTKNVGSISLALQEVAVTAPAPMDYELELISRQEQELKSFTKALTNARGRLKSQWFDIVTAVLQTAEEKGGKTSAALGNLSRVFVQLKAMQQKIDTATSQGRTSMKVMLVMPFVVIAIVYFVDPDLIGLATSNAAGVTMIWAAGFAYIIAVAVAVWLSRVEI